MSIIKIPNDSVTDSDVENIYKKYISNTEIEYETLLTEDPNKFYQIIKNSKKYGELLHNSKFKIFEKVCNMIKSINHNEISLGLDILDIIIPYTDSSLLENAFTFSKKNDTTFGLFLYSLEESKEIKIKTLKIISKHHEKLQAEKHFDYLLELINDEEKEVRYEAVNCLEVLIPYIKKFKYETCEIILFSLNEQTKKLRNLFLKLLTKLKIEITQDEFSGILNLLNKNFQSFPCEIEKILKYIKNFTENNYECLDDNFFINQFGFDDKFYTYEFNWENISYLINMVVFSIYLNKINYKCNINIPKFVFKHLFHYQRLYPKIFEVQKLNNLKNKLELTDDEIINENQDLNNNTNEIKNKLLSDYNMNITYTEFYNFIQDYFKNKNEKIDENIISLILNILKFMNLLISEFITEDNLFNFNKELIKLLERYNDENYINDNNEAEIINLFEKNNIFENFLSNYNTVKIPVVNINKLKDYQVYNDVKLGNKYFPFVVEFQILIYNIKNFLKTKNLTEKYIIYFQNIFNCYFVVNGEMDKKFDVNLFGKDFKITLSKETDYVSIKGKYALFLSNIQKPKKGMQEILFILEFKDGEEQDRNNIMKKLTFYADI